MPDAQPQPVLDGYISYAGGMHGSATNPRELAENQLSHLVNATVRGGFLRPRDGFTHVPLKFTNAEDRKTFEGGRFQGEEFYGEIERIVYAIDGRIFSVDPTSGEVTRHSAGGQKQPLSEQADFIFLEERDGYVVCQDGTNRAVILDRYAARQCDPQAEEIPTGTVMADGWGRLMLANPDRNRIYFSDHELDPESKSWLFTEEDEYYLAAKYFQPPRRIDKIMAAEYMPFVDAPSGFGPLIVFGRRGSVTYDMSIPRSTGGGWVVNQIERLTLLNIGTCGHRTVMAVDNDIVFRDQHGRMRTLSQTIREQEQRKNSQRVRRFDREVQTWIDRETKWLRRWSDVSNFDDRYLFTVLPNCFILPGNRMDVWHLGVLAFNLDVLANVRGQEDPVWDGLLTGLRVQAVTSGLFGGDPRLYLLSRDSDGTRRLYEQQPGLTYDSAPRPNQSTASRKAIEWQVGTRWLDWKSPFIQKKLHAINLRLGDVRGRLKLEVFARKRDGAWTPWFTHYAAACDTLEFSGPCGGCGICEAQPGEHERIVLPALPVSLETFYRLQVMFRITGWCELREFMIEALPEVIAPGNTSIVAEAPPLYRTNANDWNDLTYDAVQAPEESA